jgi:hypothetical protein
MRNVHDPRDKEAEDEARKDSERSLVRKYAKNVYRLIDDNLGSFGGIEGAAGIVGLDRGELRRAIDRGSPNQPRYLYVDHVMALLARLRQHNAGKATELAAALVYPAGFLVFPLVEMTAEEKARRLEQMLRSMPLGEQLIEEALKKP